jgi:hypothetical protein
MLHCIWSTGRATVDIPFAAAEAKSVRVTDVRGSGRTVLGSKGHLFLLGYTRFQQVFKGASDSMS